MSKNDHPIALELKSLRSAFENYQHAAHVSALQLQRARSDAADASRRVKLLETENDILKREVSYLRSNVEPIQASRQTTELSLALRRLSDKLSFTEQSLLQKTSECLQTTHMLNKSKVELKFMQSNIDGNRTLLEEYLSKESLLTVRCKAAEEEVKMAMAVINDYASLVRSLQRDLTLAKNPETPSIPTSTSSSASDENSLSTAILNSFQHSRKSLHQLLSEANAETTSLHTEMAHLHNELSVARTDLEAERETCRIDRERLAKAFLEIDRYKADDNAAEKMVSRYMRFSQSSIDTLQIAVSSLKTRHAATLATLSTTSEMLTKALEEERTRVSQMRDILDELTEDISRETYGRRREVSLRLRHVAREELLLENLKNWIRRAEDRYLRIASGNVAEQAPSPSLLSTYNVMMEEARNVLISSDYSESNDSNSESMSNVLLAEHLCSTLKSELQTETEKRLELAKRLGNYYAQLSAPAPIISEPDQKGQTNISPEVPSDDSGTSANVDVAQSGSITSPAENSTDIDMTLKDSPGSTQSHSLNSDPVTQECPPEGADPLKSQISFEEQPAIDPKCEKVQKRFTDCHSALQQLRLLLLDKANVLDSQRSLLLNVVLRLDDYCEDVRVELEIHIADIERIKRGLQTVNNFHPPSKSSTPTEDLNQLFDAKVNNDLLESFEKKLSDLEHDIVQVKTALYDSESSTSVFNTNPSSKSPSKSPTWSLFSSSAAPYHDPIPPSFGTVITAPKSRRIYSLAGYASSHDALSLKDPYSRLNLRISMPSQHPPWESVPLASPLGIKPHANHLRVTRSASSLYQVGLHSPRRTFDGETPKTPEQSIESIVVDNDHADVE